MTQDLRTLTEAANGWATPVTKDATEDERDELKAANEVANFLLEKYRMERDALTTEVAMLKTVLAGVKQDESIVRAAAQMALDVMAEENYVSRYRYSQVVECLGKLRDALEGRQMNSTWSAA